MHFMFGTLAYTLAATDTVQLIAGCKPEDRYDARLLEERLTAFLAAGLHAPSRLRSRRPLRRSSHGLVHRRNPRSHPRFGYFGLILWWTLAAGLLTWYLSAIANFSTTNIVLGAL